MAMTQRELYGSWVQMIHVAQAQGAEDRTRAGAAAWAARAQALTECARGLRAMAELDLPDPEDIHPRRDDESEAEYEIRIGLRGAPGASEPRSFKPSPPTGLHFS